MEIKSQVNTFDGGMDMDTDVSYLETNKYRYAENVRLATDQRGTAGVLQNIQYFKEYAKIEALEDQTILCVIAGRLPDDDANLINTAIILTVDNSTGYNNIFLVDNFNNKQLVCTKVLSMTSNITSDSNVSMVYNYETSSVYKLYINVPDKGLFIINLANYREETDEVIDNSSQFYSDPDAVLPPLLLDSYTSGSLPAGAYQYFYKLITEDGIESPLSSGSELIYLGRANIDSSATAEGYDEEYTTSFGINLTVTLNNDTFTTYRLYRVYWANNVDDPSVMIAQEGSISNAGTITFTVTDSYNSAISQITSEELNDIIPFTFYAQTMAQYGNRLFFANIQTNDWDIDSSFDCRAYRANCNGKVLLQASSGETEYEGPLSSILDGTVVLDYDADVINPMNSQLLYPDVYDEDEYAYQSNGIVYGGEGPNISFKIVHGTTRECTATMLGGLTDYTSTSMPISGIKNDSSYDSVSFGSTQLCSFANPYIASKFASYQRDEIYRFGIVFYNESGISTPVHWICDIRFPSGDSDSCAAFNYNSTDNYMEAYPFGVYFQIKNFPTGAVAAEIVRCDRTQSDRTVVGQGMVNNSVYWYNISMSAADGSDSGQVDSDASNGSGDIRCPFVPTMKEWVQTRTDNDTMSIFPLYGSLRTSWGQRVASNSNYAYDCWYPCRTVKLFASPEVCMNRTVDFIENSYSLVPVYELKALSNMVNQTDSINSYAIGCYGARDGYSSEGYNGLICWIYKQVDSNDNLCRIPCLICGWNNTTRADGVVIKYFDVNSARTLMKNNCSNWDNYEVDDRTARYTISIDNVKLANTDLPVSSDDETYTVFKGSYVDTIGGLSYTNNAVASDVFGIAGINALIAMPSSLDATNIFYNAFSEPTIISVADDYAHYGDPENGTIKINTILTNIKRTNTPYGGISYLSRANCTYMSCGGYISQSEGSKVVFGGDVFLTIFDYLNAGQFTRNDYLNDGDYYHKFCHVYLPVESVINCYMRSDDYYLKDVDSNTTPNDSDDNRFYYQTNSGAINGHTQETNMYEYNSVYSVSAGAISYAPGSTNENISTTEYNMYEVVCSEAKSAGEEIDSWQTSKFANTLELDASNGHISQFVQLNNKLYVLQQNALSVLAVNDRSLITDEAGAALALGSGGVLERYDVIVKNYGTSTLNDYSAISTFQSIYWYDNNKNVICSYGNDGFHILSKEKKVQSFLDSLSTRDDRRILAVSDDKMNEVWMTFSGKSLVYNEHGDVFTSLFTYTPDWQLRFYDRLITIKDNQFYYTNTYGQEDEVLDRTCKIKFVINQDEQDTKVFDNQWFAGNIEDPNVFTNPETISSIQYHTKTQDSYIVDHTGVECREDTYRLPIPRQDRSEYADGNEDTLNMMNRSYQPRMRGKYLICDYEFNCNNDREFQIPFIKTTYRKSNV